MTNQDRTFILTLPEEFKVPILISVPHCGTSLTDDFKNRISSPKILKTPDTDWYLEDLYGFASSLGIPTIKAVYSRYMIDLNRQLPSDRSLYQDKNRATALVPLSTFHGVPIYKKEMEPNGREINQRIETYYHPYYQAVHNILQKLKKQFSYVLLFDGHSIKGVVPDIQREPFHDYHPANRSGTTCPPEFMEQAERIITKYKRSCSPNFPFMGGNITRNFYSKAEGIFTFQLEMSQRIYMNEQSLEKDHDGWKETLIIIKEIVESFMLLLNQLNRTKQ